MYTYMYVLCMIHHPELQIDQDYFYVKLNSEGRILGIIP